MQGKKIQIPGDVVAAVTGGVASIPDGMACAVMAGINPVQGLYASIIGPLVGSWTTSSVFMSVTTTSALGLAMGSALGNESPQDKLTAVAFITLLAGLIQIAMSFLNLGHLLRFVSNSVMRGFLSGIAISIILGQIPDFTGNYDSQYSNKAVRAIDILAHPSHWNWWIIGTSILSIILILAIKKSKFKIFSMFIALVVISLAAHILNIESLRLVGEESPIPENLPAFAFPEIIKNPDFILSAIAIALIGFIQGAGVSQIRPNPNGKYPNESGDLRGQGFSNIFIGLFSGIPVGGSVSASSLFHEAGAKSRWSFFLSGILIAVLVFFFSILIEKIPLAVFAAMLIVTGYEALNKDEILTIWNTSVKSRGVMLFSFISTIALPVQMAVLLSVVFTFFLHVVRESNRIKLVSIEPDKLWYRQIPLPKILESNKVIGILPYGSLFFAGAYVMERILPSPKDAKRSVIIFILRGKEEIGSTFINVIKKYHETLKKRESKLILLGASDNVYEQLERTGLINQLGKENVHKANEYVGKTFRKVWDEEMEWVRNK
jgi:SulP family sulfate permease